MSRVDRTTRDAILRRVFPDLQYGDDPDIGRYFELRKAGRVAEALAIYNRSLRARYPDDRKRIVLLNLYRRNDPRFSDFHDSLLWNLFDSVADRLRRNLDALNAPLEGINLKNTYRVLKAMESIVSLLPPDSEEVLNILDAYEAYAEKLAYKLAETRRVRFLAGEYFAQASDREPEETDFLARSQAVETRRREHEQQEKSFFDLSKISFSAEDIARIEIPRQLERKEDRVVAFCYKYWLRVDDPAFERIVFLYSRKYGTPHYDVFRTIKLGRARKFTDDEILNRVSTALSSRYSYSVQGDLYMQQAWHFLKAQIMGTAIAAREEAAAAANAIQEAPRRGQEEPKEKPAKTPAPDSRQKLLNRTPQRKHGSLAPSKRPEPVPVLAPRGSVSDHIKRLSGRHYDVYHEEFLARVRPSIQAWLTAHRKKPKEVFGDSLNKAEDLVYEFLEKNYANPYMNWESSNTRSVVEELGYSLPSLDGIIELWYQNR